MKALLFLVALIANTNAHMVMSHPPPIGNPSNSPCNNRRNPSADSGGEFPCKVVNFADYQNAQITTLQAGGRLDVTFLGSAVHGGGSCQFSLTKSLAPDSSTPFKVIHSVEGGCPARNEAGNILPADPSFKNPSTYSVPIPAQLSAGRYTFSWSWVNKVGNREFYMNCAAVEIGNSANTTTSSDTFYDSLPDMVILNTNSDDCTNPEGEGSYRFANPGASLERNEDMSNVRLILPQCIPGGKKVTSPTGDLSTNAGSTLPPTPSTSGFTTKTARPTPKSTGGFASGSATDPSVTAGDDPNTTNPDTVIVPNTSDTTSPPCPATQSRCTTLGFACLTPTTFTKCARLGDCALIESMAAGTRCENGAVLAADGSARRWIHAKRALAVGHARRWHGGGRRWGSEVAGHVH